MESWAKVYKKNNNCKKKKINKWKENCEWFQTCWITISISCLFVFIISLLHVLCCGNFPGDLMSEDKTGRTAIGKIVIKRWKTYCNVSSFLVGFHFQRFHVHHIVLSYQNIIICWKPQKHCAQKYGLYNLNYPRWVISISLTSVWLFFFAGSKKKKIYTLSPTEL